MNQKFYEKRQCTIFKYLWVTEDYKTDLTSLTNRYVPINFYHAQF